MAFKTPGVYVEEISVFPPSVAEVETAIPAFIGYTEKAERRGESLTNSPTRVSSLLEYHQYYGGAHEIATVNVTVDENNNHAVTAATVATRFYMYEALRLFFDNGGGDCYIISVGSYSDPIQNGNESVASSTGFRVGLKALEKADEPTMILFPDAVLLADEDHFYTLQQLALAQCNKLQDRVAILDIYEDEPNRSWEDSYKEFRNKIGINNLKYGASYTPWLRSAYPKVVDYSIFSGNVTDGNGAVDLATITSDSDLNNLVTSAATAVTDRSAVEATIAANKSTSPTLKDRYKFLKNDLDAGTTDLQRKTRFKNLLGFVRDLAVDVAAWSSSLGGSNLQNDLNAYAASTLKAAVEGLVAFEKNADVRTIADTANEAAVDTAYGDFDSTGWLDDADQNGVAVDEIGADATDYGTGPTFTAEEIATMVGDLDGIFQDSANSNVLTFIEQVVEAAGTQAGIAQTTLYDGHTVVGNIVENIKRELGKVPPSGAIAGVYAFVDRTRGVWKAPANVSLSSTSQPLETIDHFEQEDLNVDVNGGKSINAIRTFTGRGILVWGARTLAGNDNEWRYVPVRRFFNMVEESVKKSTSWAVFEPNSAPLWTRVKSMIDNFLVQKWRDGALAGATPEEAFFVKVGLGETMTAQDILEGRMNVEIGMAVVRPAEFIILKFSHKMQES